MENSKSETELLYDAAILLMFIQRKESKPLSLSYL